MITRVIVNDFKNFRGKLSITLCDPHTDSYFLDVIVGRNGSGKSCVLEAIEWCLSSLSARDVRGSNMKDLVNIHSIKASMAVTVEIYCKEENSLIAVTRSFNGRTCISTCEQIASGTKTRVAIDDIPRILSSMGIHVDRMDGIRIKQNQSIVACLSPLGLLEFIESLSGSITFKKKIEQNASKLAGLVTALNGLNANLDEQNKRIELLLPVVESTREYLSRSMQLCVRQITVGKRKIVLLDKSLETMKMQYDHTQSLKWSMEKEVHELRTSMNSSLLLVEQKEDAASRAELLLDVSIRAYKRVLKECRVVGRRNEEHEQNFEQMKKGLSSLQEKIVDLDNRRALLSSRRTTLSSDLESALLFLERFDAFHEECKLCSNMSGLLEAFSVYRLLDEQTLSLSHIPKSVEEFNLKFSLYERESARFLKANKIAELSIKEVTSSITALQQQEDEVCLRLKDLKLGIRDTENSIDTLNRTREGLSAELTYLKETAPPVFDNILTLEQLVASLRTEDPDISGMLLQLAHPVKDCYGTALMSVLGNKAATTIVTRTRNCAIKLARDLQAHNIFSSVILIYEEYNGGVPTSYTNQPTRGREDLMALFDSLRIVEPNVGKVFEQMLDSWYLFVGSGSEGDRFLLQRCDQNIVCLDGSQYRRDGEIKLTFGTQGAKAEKKNGIKKSASCAWPALPHENIINTGDDLDDRCKEITDSIQEMQTALSKYACEKLEIEKLLSELRANMKKLATKQNQLQKSIKKIPPPPTNTAADGGDDERYQLLLERRKTAEKNLRRIFDAKLSNNDGVDLMLGELRTRQSLLTMQTEIGIAEDEAASLGDLINQLKGQRSELSSQLAGDAAALSSRHHSSLLKTELKNMMLEDALSNGVRSASLKEELASIGESILSTKKTILYLDSRSKSFGEDLLHIQIDMELITASRTETATRIISREDDLSRIRRVLELNNEDIVNSNENEGSSWTREQVEELEGILFEEESFLKSKVDEYDFSCIQFQRELEIGRLGLERDIQELQVEGRGLHDLNSEATAKRFSVLMLALQSINRNIGVFYKKLVDGGECYLSFSSDCLSLFNEGITMIARGNFRPWTEINKLSGGQQAACGVALLVAFQEILSSPFFLFDEVDAFLDTHTSLRLGQLLKQRSIEKEIQFIVVSHHPELQQGSSRIIGLYHTYDSSVASSSALFV